MERTKNGEFNWVDLSARDFEGQSKFYEALFGWTRADVPFMEGMTYRMFKSGEHTVAGAAQLSPDQIAQGRPSMWNIYLAADDIDATVAKAAELGATVIMPPGDVPGDVGRIAAIQDPTGAYIFFWKPKRTDESMEYMQTGAFFWADLATRDTKKAIDFYSKLLGWEIKAMEGGSMPYWVVNVGGQGEGGIMPMPDMVPKEVPSYWLPYFGSADVQASVDKAVSLGATVLAPLTEVPNMVVFAVLADPAGASFAVMKALM